MPDSRPALSRILILAAVMASHSSALEAKSLRECGRSVRIGSKLLMIGDDAQRAESLFARNSKWTKKRSSKSSAVWRSSGVNKRTVRLKIKDGEITDICQRG